TSAQAGIITDIAGSIVAKISFYIGLLLSHVGSVVFGFSAYLTNFALEFNFKILDENVNSIVPTGWVIVRDIANLGFVLVIIVIAIATILRREEYGVKKLLPKLIGAAIIVNFSLVVAGVFIDFSHVLSAFFFNKIAGGNYIDIASNLASAFDPQKLLSAKDAGPFGLDLPSDLSGLEVIIESMTNLVFIAFFTFTASFAMLALALMLLARYLWLTFLLIISPIVWLFWIIPLLSSQFSKWWSKFLKWTFFAPAVSFFVYLSIKSVEGLKNFSGTASSKGEVIFEGQSSLFTTIMSHGAQMIVLVGLLIGGIMLAENMGITGARASMGLAKKMGG
ncbi:MAG: hypothetical protein AAB884_02660, partial [Patescibacteria group bacterium]